MDSIVGAVSAIGRPYICRKRSTARDTTRRSVVGLSSAVWRLFCEGIRALETICRALWVIHARIAVDRLLKPITSRLCGSAGLRLGTTSRLRADPATTPSKNPRVWRGGLGG